ncbi:MAG: hypothetical protein R2713_04565 [Ilumatobacteraceae bacterium]
MQQLVDRGRTATEQVLGTIQARWRSSSGAADRIDSLEDRIEDLAESIGVRTGSADRRSSSAETAPAASPAVRRRPPTSRLRRSRLRRRSRLPRRSRLRRRSRERRRSRPREEAGGGEAAGSGGGQQRCREGRDQEGSEALTQCHGGCVSTRSWFDVASSRAVPRRAG